jgi:hypothetical protein
MKIDKSQVLEMIREYGDGAKAQDAERELPADVDTDRDGGLLSKYGLDVGDLIGKLGGGGGLGGLLR